MDLLDMAAREVPVERYAELPADVARALLALFGARLRGDLHPASSLFDLPVRELPAEFQGRY